jgi:hypothetical protein
MINAIVLSLNGIRIQFIIVYMIFPVDCEPCDISSQQLD